MGRIFIRLADAAKAGAIKTVELAVGTRDVLDSFFRTDSTKTHMTIQVTQLRLNSKPKFTNLTQLWLNSFEQSWVNSDSRLITFYLIWENVVDRGGGCGRM